MKNYVQPGNTITLTAPYAVASGDGLLVGSIFGVASGDADDAAIVEAALVGVFDLKKVASQAWGVGDKIYWDNANKQTTKTATSNTLIGVAVEAVANGAGDVVGRVRLNGAAV
jgi:predicted RecA/RadA family phage recombinase